MSRVFGYARVSTAEQTTSNQIAEIRAAGFDVQPQRMVTETVSGSSAGESAQGVRETAGPDGVRRRVGRDQARPAWPQYRRRVGRDQARPAWPQYYRCH